MGSIIRCAPKLSFTSVCAVSTPVYAGSSASLPGSTSSTPEASWEEKVQKGEQQRLFKDIWTDAIPADFERYEEPHSETPLTVEVMNSCVLPPNAR